MEIRIIDEHWYNWEDLKKQLWCCDYQIELIEKYDKQDEVMQILYDIGLEEDMDIVKCNDIIRFDMLEILELEEE